MFTTAPHFCTFCLPMFEDLQFKSSAFDPNQQFENEDNGDEIHFWLANLKTWFSLEGMKYVAPAMDWPRMITPAWIVVHKYTNCISTDTDRSKSFLLIVDYFRIDWTKEDLRICCCSVSKKLPPLVDLWCLVLTASTKIHCTVWDEYCRRNQHN